MRQRCLYRARGNIDDPAEAPADHAIDDGFDHHDWRDHVGIDRTHPCRFIPVAKIANRWTASIVDEDVGLGATTEDSLSALAGRYIGGNCANANTRFTADCLSRRFEECGSSPVDDDVDTLAGECERATSAEAFARCADDCFPSFNTQVHRRASLPFVTATAPPAGGDLCTAPSFMIAISRLRYCKMPMSLSGSPSTRIRSARKPTRTWPSSSARPMMAPPHFVAATMASMGVNPRSSTKYLRSLALRP